MKTDILYLIFLFLIPVAFASAQKTFESDTISTDDGQLIMTFIGHGTLLFHYNDLVIHIDPVGRYADYTRMPKADIILITHHHGDHLDVTVVNQIKKSDTEIVLSESCTDKLSEGKVMQNGDVMEVKGLKIEAVPAYNLVHKRDNGEPFHPKGVGNGYVIAFGDKRVYIAGDTENVPEMADLKNIYCAFLPMNVPYTMTPEMVAQAVQMFHPKILYPYHYGNTDVNQLLDLLKDNTDLEIRVRQLQ
jgi:L-ascorbate metabolism protein UlaG (beta-lactamase superfamily)